jgi:hypothetical protein
LRKINILGTNGTVSVPRLGNARPALGVDTASLAPGEPVVDRRNIDDLIRYIDGDDSKKKAGGRKKRSNPRRRGGATMVGAALTLEPGQF